MRLVLPVCFEDVLLKPVTQEVEDIDRNVGLSFRVLGAEPFNFFGEIAMFNLVDISTREIRCSHRALLGREVLSCVEKHFGQNSTQYESSLSPIHGIEQFIQHAKQSLVLHVEALYSDTVGIIPIDKSQFCTPKPISPEPREYSRVIPNIRERRLPLNRNVFLLRSQSLFDATRTLFWQNHKNASVMLLTGSQQCHIRDYRNGILLPFWV
jgi:hypothetical protein